MSHHDHSHSPGHDHHQDHDHDHDHHQDRPHDLTTGEKLAKLFDHWVAHNESHARSYREWSKRAKEEGLPEIAALLDNIIDMNDRITEKMNSGRIILDGLVKSRS